MKYNKISGLLFIIVLIFNLQFAGAQNSQNEIQTSTKLALTYYNSKEYEKAAPLLLEVYHLSRNNHYLRLYLTSLIELKQYDEAEKQIRKEIENKKSPAPELYIHWGYLLKAQKNMAEAQEKYARALELTPRNKGNYLITANEFLQWQEFEWMKKTYLQGRENIPGEPFHYELARAYLYLRNYEEMLEEYLNLVKQDETQISRIQSVLASTLRLDADDGLRTAFRAQILKRIQAEPGVTAYNRLLIWFFLQDKQFAGALRQAIALDLRTGQEDGQIFQLGHMALNNQLYSEAERAFNYLIRKGRENPFYVPASVQNLHASYLRYTTGKHEEQTDGRQLAENFSAGLDMLGYHSGTLNLIIDYARLLAFYLGEYEKAISVIKSGIGIPRLKPEESGMLKAELADIHILSGDLWEATLLYSQVIDANKTNMLGDEVKLKKARLGYYMGNFSWAKAQLDVLKASTSKLTANDAMDLSMLIGNNLDLDSTAVPLKMFARADLLFFRNRESEAMATLDSIKEIFPYHSLTDQILFRKAKIETGLNNFETAVGYLQEITQNFGYGLLADDALYMMADIYNYQLNRKEKAKELYRDMLARHPGSVFAEESRKKFRELRELFPDVLTMPQQESIIQDSFPDEAN